MDRETALALISSIIVVAGLFVALLLTRLESWRADARSAAAGVRATRQGDFGERGAALRSELRCWEVADDVPIFSSVLIDVIVAGSGLATYVVAQGVTVLADSARALAAPSIALLVLVVAAQLLFIGSGLGFLRAAPYATFKKHP